MNKKQFAEALYALPGDIVIKGRKSLAMPLLAAVAGIVLVVVGILFAPMSGWEDLKLTCVLLGGLIFVAGAFAAFLRLSGYDTVPLYGGNRVPLVWIEGYYDRQAAAQVTDCMTRRNWSRLRELQLEHAAPVRLVGYRTPDESFVACRAFLYEELEERPLTDLLVADRRDAKA